MTIYTKQRKRKRKESKKSCGGVERFFSISSSNDDPRHALREVFSPTVTKKKGYICVECSFVE